MRRVICLLALMVLAATPLHAEPHRKTVSVKRPHPRALDLAPADAFVPLADVAEAEPNDDASSAQAVACGNAFRPARLVNQPLADQDWITFTAVAGELITFETAPDPDFTDPIPEADTYISLLAADGTTVLAFNDDVSTSTLYSRIADFEAPYSGVYFGRIVGFDGSEGHYRASVSCAPVLPPPANDQCAGALTIAPGNIALSGTTRYATNDYDLCPGTPQCGSCTGFHSPGKDVVYRIVVSSPNELITLSYEVTPASVDASLYIVTDCSNPFGSCVAGKDSDLLTPVEQLTHTFASPGVYYLILDGFTSGGGSWTLTGCLGCPTSVVPVSWGRLKAIYR